MTLNVAVCINLVFGYSAYYGCLSIPVISARRLAYVGCLRLTLSLHYDGSFVRLASMLGILCGHYRHSMYILIGILSVGIVSIISAPCGSSICLYIYSGALSSADVVLRRHYSRTVTCCFWRIRLAAAAAH